MVATQCVPQKCQETAGQTIDSKNNSEDIIIDLIVI